MLMQTITLIFYITVSRPQDERDIFYRLLFATRSALQVLIPIETQYTLWKLRLCFATQFLDIIPHLKVSS
jgi:hypothetical protein